MGHGTELERVNVTLNGGEVDADLLGAGEQHLGVVDTLGAGHDLFTADENVVGVGVGRVFGVLHRVERTDVRGELIDDVEVLLVFAVDDLAEDLLVLGANVLRVAMVGNGGEMGTLVLEGLGALGGSLDFFDVVLDDGRALFTKKLHGVLVFELQAGVPTKNLLKKN